MSCLSELFVFSLLSLLPSSGLFNIAVGGKKILEVIVFSVSKLSKGKNKSKETWTAGKGEN